MWSALFSLFLVPFDTLILVVSRQFALGLVLLVFYFAVSYPLRLFATSQSLQVNDYSFLLLFSLFHFLGISSYFSLYVGHPLNFFHPLKYVVGGKFFVFLLVYYGRCLLVWDHYWCVISCKSGVYYGGGLCTCLMYVQ